MIWFGAGIALGIALMSAAIVFMRTLFVPAVMLRLFKGIPKTMRFDLATPQSMRNMVVMAEPWLEPWFSERAAGRMLAELREHHPPPASRIDRDAIDQPNRAVTYFPSGHPPIGVTLPPEHGPLDAVIVAWPWHYPCRWEPHAKLIRAIVGAGARAIVLVSERHDQESLKTFLAAEGVDLSAIDLVHGPVDDVWVRDYGPTFIHSPNGPAIIANAYAPGEHPYRKGDNVSSFVIGAALQLPVYRLPLLIEGGNMVTDGHGLMVMTTAVLDRNPELSRDDVADIMRTYFGCDRMLLIETLPAEVTGHADMSLRFLSPHHVVVASAPKGHRWAAAFDRLAATLADTKAYDGKQLKVDRLPIAISAADKNAFWSYVNCLQVNGTVIMPTFGQGSDEQALAFYRQATGATVVGIDFSDFLVGSAHCQTKEVPRDTLSPRLQ